MTLAYDGAHFNGWQRQEGVPSVQQTLEEALLKITNEKSVVHGSGRTDAGVHALGQVANFQTTSSIPSAELHRALNAILPRSIRVWNLALAPSGFHARKSATGKRYAYRIFRGEIPPPFGRDYYTHIKYDLSLGAMREAAERIRGKRDFAAFGTNPGYQLLSTVRTVRHLHLVDRGCYLWLLVQGDGFLYNMVRTIAGTLIEVGRGRFSPNNIEEILDSGDRREAGPVLPAAGLALLRVLYGNESVSPCTGGRCGTKSYLPRWS